MSNKDINILIVDDDFHFNLDILSYHLNRIGKGKYKIDNAFTMKDFKDKAPEADIIILDIRLPESKNSTINPWGGLVALKSLQNQFPNDSKYRKHIIIRSVQSKSDAINAQIPIPDHYDWIEVDAPLSKLMTTLNRLENEIKKDKVNHEFK